MIFGNLGNMGEMMKQAMKMQGELKKIKEELKHARYTAEVNGVCVTIDGEMEIKEIKISAPSDTKKMEEAVKQSVNNALRQAKDDAAARLKGATGGMQLPGLS